MSETLRNSGRADRIIAFLELLPIPDGPAVGQLIKIDAWEERFIRDIYEPEHADGRRVVRRAVLSVARKNRKSLIIAGLLLVHLIGPESQRNAQIYTCAVTQKQAKVIFKMCVQMIEMKSVLRDYLGVTESTSTIYVKRTDCKGRGSTYQALSADGPAKHGLGADFFVYDEFGEARDGDLYNVLLDSQQLRLSPLAVVISTQNNDPTHPLSQLIDDGLSGVDPSLVCHLYAADDDCALDDRAQWLKANPTLATWKPYEAIEIAAGEAKRMPAQEQNFRRRYLNQRVSLHSNLIAQADWRACEYKAIKYKPKQSIFLGLDLSIRTDLTALLSITDGAESHAQGWFWKPRYFVQEHTKRDRIRYDLFAEQGFLELSDGRAVDPRAVVSASTAAQATQTVAADMPSDFSQGDLFWMAGFQGNSDNRPVASGWSFPTVSGEGVVAQSPASTGGVDISHRSIMASVPGRRYRAVIRAKSVSASAGLDVFQIVMGSQNASSAISTPFIQSVNLTTSFADYTVDFVATSGPYQRLLARIISRDGTSQSGQIARISLTDVTDVVAAQTAATASAGSASLAQTKADAAGISASAALASQTAANTSAGNASTSASQASTSATNALGSANSATTSQAASATSAAAASAAVKATVPDNFTDPTNWQAWNN